MSTNNPGQQKPNDHRPPLCHDEQYSDVIIYDEQRPDTDWIAVDKDTAMEVQE